MERDNTLAKFFDKIIALKTACTIEKEIRNARKGSPTISHCNHCYLLYQNK